MSARIVAPPLAGRAMGSIDTSFVVAEWQDAGGPARPPRPLAARHGRHQGHEGGGGCEGKLVGRGSGGAGEAGGRRSGGRRGRMGRPGRYGGRGGLAFGGEPGEAGAARRKLPLGGALREDYVFEGTGGPVRLSELFAPGKDTLLVYNLRGTR